MDEFRLKKVQFQEINLPILIKKSLIRIMFYRGLDKDIEGSTKRWKKFVEAECPEREKFPQEWKNKTGLQKLCIMRALRPDRLSHAIQ